MNQNESTPPTPAEIPRVIQPVLTKADFLLLMGAAVTGIMYATGDFSNAAIQGLGVRKMLRLNGVGQWNALSDHMDDLAQAAWDLKGATAGAFVGPDGQALSPFEAIVGVKPVEIIEIGTVDELEEYFNMLMDKLIKDTTTENPDAQL